MATIIVVQTSHAGFIESRRVLKEMKLIEDKDFLLLDCEPDLENFIPNTRQLFITGSFSGLHDGVAEMVQAARDRNKDLVTVSFSIDELEGPFDHRIVKRMDAWEQFRKIVEDFRNGVLARSPEDTGLNKLDLYGQIALFPTPDGDLM